MDDREPADRIAERLTGWDPPITADTLVRCLHCDRTFRADTPGRVLAWTLGPDGPPAIGCPTEGCTGYPEMDWMPEHA